MEYYKILDLKKEPFSNSPEPEFLFQSPQHMGCLQKLELAIRLRRGLNVIIGDVGTGKTTLCRKLIQGFSATQEDAETIETHLLLDPSFKDPRDFLQNVASMLGIKDLDDRENEWQLKEKIKDYLFNKGVTEGKIVLLVIDEGQKIAEACLEILREFLNYETNDCKLLQIVIFAQQEFKVLLEKHENLTDRINLFYYLNPLNFAQTRAMIKYRIDVARNLESGPSLFNFWALLAIYSATGGYPRKVVSLCHQVILMLIIQGKKKAGYFYVRRCLNEMMTPVSKKIKWAPAFLLLVIACVILAAGFFLEYQNINLFELTIPVQKAIPEVRKEISATVRTAAPIIPAPVSVAAVTPKGENAEHVMPEHIGTLTLKKGRTLWRMLQNVYGDSSPDIMQVLVEANPQIKDMNKIGDGTVLNIPALPVETKPLKNGDFIVQIKAGKKLEEEYVFYRENPSLQEIPETIFLSYWNKREGMIFSIVLNKCFNNKEAAQSEIRKLPAAVAAEAKIISHWDDKTIFFNRHSFKCSGAGVSGG